MSAIKKKPKKRIIIIAALFVAVIIATVLTMALWGNNYSAPASKVSVQLLDKSRNVQKTGGTMELSNEDLNSIISMYFKTPKIIGSIVIKGIHGEMQGDKVVIYMPVSYRGINLLISTEGNLNSKENKIIYIPDYFKVGKLPIPKGFVFNKLSQFEKDGLSFKNNEIAMDEKASPLPANKIKTENNKITINVKKSKNNIEDTIAAFSSKNESKSSSKNSTNKKSENTSKNENSGERDKLLTKISESLYSAAGNVSGNGSEVIRSMASSVKNMIGNPSANPYSGAGAAKAAYSKLSSEEKTKVKAAIYSNLDGEAVNEYEKIFGIS